MSMADEHPERPTRELIRLGLRGQCPRCAYGRIFSAYLTLANACPNCDLKLTGSDVGDGPVVPAMLLIGGLIVGMAAVTELTWQLPLWLHAMLWLPLAIFLVALILPPIKGLTVALQHRYRSTEEDTRPGGQ
jgi:uncharacterized protein (DUF983 family)